MQALEWAIKLHSSGPGRGVGQLRKGHLPSCTSEGKRKNILWGFFFFLFTFTLMEKWAVFLANTTEISPFRKTNIALTLQVSKNGSAWKYANLRLASSLSKIHSFIYSTKIFWAPIMARHCCRYQGYSNEQDEQGRWGSCPYGTSVLPSHPALPQDCQPFASLQLLSLPGRFLALS